MAFIKTNSPKILIRIVQRLRGVMLYIILTSVFTAIKLGFITSEFSAETDICKKHKPCVPTEPDTPYFDG